MPLTWPLKISLVNRKVVFKPNIFSGYVSFPQGAKNSLLQSVCSFQLHVTKFQHFEHFEHFELRLLTDQRKVWCHMSSPIRHWMRYQPDLVSRIAIEDLCCLRSLLQTSSQHENANAQRVGSPGLRRTARCYVMLV